MKAISPTGVDSLPGTASRYWCLDEWDRIVGMTRRRYSVEISQTVRVRAWSR